MQQPLDAPPGRPTLCQRGGRSPGQKWMLQVSPQRTYKSIFKLRAQNAVFFISWKLKAFRVLSRWIGS